MSENNMNYVRFISLFKPNDYFCENFKKYSKYSSIEINTGYELNHIEDYREFIIELAFACNYQLMFKKVPSGIEYIIMDDNDFRQK